MCDTVITYPAMRQFLGAYLHQDWSKSYESPWAALDDFIQRQSRFDVESLVNEIDAVLKSHDEQSARLLVLDELDSYYLVEADGWSYMDWLRAVQERVKNALAQDPG